MNNIINETCEIIDEIKNELNEHDVHIIADYKSGNNYYIMTEFMIITYSDEENIIDVASFFALILSDFGVEVNIMEVYIRDEDGKVWSGNQCVEKHQEKMKNIVLNEFMEDQFQIHYLQHSQLGRMC